MTWKPSYPTREQIEERRLEGGRLLKAGKLTQAEIARQLSVSRATVSDWAKKGKAKGIRGLRKRIAKGGTSKLTKEQKQKFSPNRLTDAACIKDSKSSRKRILSPSSAILVGNPT